VEVGESGAAVPPGGEAYVRVRLERPAVLTRGDRVIHVAVHSFTPTLRGVRRNADVGLLYDPARPGELALARRWRAVRSGTSCTACRQSTS